MCCSSAVIINIHVDVHAARLVHLRLRDLPIQVIVAAAKSHSEDASVFSNSHLIVSSVMMTKPRGNNCCSTPPAVAMWLITLHRAKNINYKCWNVNKIETISRDGQISNLGQTWTSQKTSLKTPGYFAPISTDTKLLALWLHRQFKIKCMIDPLSVSVCLWPSECCLPSVDTLHVSIEFKLHCAKLP